MKALRVILNVIISFILVVLIFALSMTFVAKKVFQEEILIGVAKDAIIEKYIDIPGSGLNDEQKNIVKGIINKKDVNKILDMVLDNYISYSIFDDYNLSKQDYDTLIKYVESHIDDINKLSDENIDMNYVKENLTYDYTNNLVKDSFAMLDEEGGMELTEDNIKLINTYAYAVSDEVKGYLFTGIGIVILLLMLVNWSISKWMLPAGISTIISASFVSMVYVFSELVKEILSNETEIGSYIANVNLSYTIMISGLLLVLGIVLIVLNSKINKLESKENME